MSRETRITDSHFNEIHGPYYHEEDHGQTYYHHDRRHYDDSSGPHIYLPQGHQSPPNQGTVNIGFASGNVNTGSVHGSLYQSEGVKRTPAAPQPSRPPPHFLMHGSAQDQDHIPRSQRQLAYHTEPMSNVPPPFAQPPARRERYPMERASTQAYSYEPQSRHRENSYHQEQHSWDSELMSNVPPPFPQPSVRHESYPNERASNQGYSNKPRTQTQHRENSYHQEHQSGSYAKGSRRPAHSQHEGQRYNDSPPPHPPPHEQRGQYSPEPFFEDHSFVQSPTGSERKFPVQSAPVKDRNPFRNMTVDATPATSPYPPPPRPAAQKAATLSNYPTSDYTSNWVAGHTAKDNTSPTQSRKWNGSPLEEDDKGFLWNVCSPSGSSATSSSPPGYHWSRTYSRASSATTFSRFSPVPEDDGGLRVDRKLRSRSPTPDLK